MKKFLVGAVLPLLLGVVLIGCASLPEPSEKCETLVYGRARYRGEREYSSDDSPAESYFVPNFRVTIKNLDTRKEYSMISNYNGELILAGIPEGRYVYTRFYYEKTVNNSKWWVWYDFPNRYIHAVFTVANGVTNLGVLELGANYSDKSGNSRWGSDLEQTQAAFRRFHPDSWWNRKTWRTFYDK